MIDEPSEDFSAEPEGEEVEVYQTVTLDNGRTLPIVLLMDKDMNPTEVPQKATRILAGSAETGYVEIDVQYGSWQSVTWH